VPTRLRLLDGAITFRSSANRLLTSRGPLGVTLPLTGFASTLAAPCGST
jgi:hypothetical protein